MANNKHLTLSDRIIIEKGLNNNSSRKSIADTWYYVKKMDKLNREFVHLVNLVP
ncbi:MULTISPECIES: hypothetical protein [Faecalicoccus]|uniref:hypothetical protein n=1 Tax=Faecalicoccus TaxID=1573536 RepID=UPI0015F2F4E9|nr:MULTISPECIES: hypothetical protein [Faecalicoccus]MDY5110807.1 hypothetical protein [Faecalicoccus sp.]